MGFLLSLGALLLFSLMAFGVDYDEFINRADLKIPDFYFWIIFVVDVVAVAALVLIYLYRRLGVYLFPATIVVHFILHNYYLSTFLYTDVTNLFLFISVGLVAFIPKWQFLK